MLFWKLRWSGICSVFIMVGGASCLSHDSCQTGGRGERAGVWICRERAQEKITSVSETGNITQTGSRTRYFSKAPPIASQLRSGATNDISERHTCTNHWMKRRVEQKLSYMRDAHGPGSTMRLAPLPFPYSPLPRPPPPPRSTHTPVPAHQLWARPTASPACELSLLLASAALRLWVLLSLIRTRYPIYDHSEGQTDRYRQHP